VRRTRHDSARRHTSRPHHQPGLWRPGAVSRVPVHPRALRAAVHRRRWPALMTRLGRLGELSAWAISAVAWALSFAAQMQLAGAHGFVGWEVWAWPATTDLAGLTGMLIALDQARRNGSTVVAWLIAIAAAAVMVAANVGAFVGDPVSMLLHAWPPS